MEEVRYSYFITFVYAREVFSFELFSNNSVNIYGNSIINFDKKLEDFEIEDYNNLKELIAYSLTEQFEQDDKKENIKFTKENIVIINIIPKKFEVNKKNEKDN